MSAVALNLPENYWETIQLDNEDIETLYNYLLETEEPKTPIQLVAVLIGKRLEREKQTQNNQQSARGRVYLPGEAYKVGETLIFAHLGLTGKVAGLRAAKSFGGEFIVMSVDFGGDSQREFAAEYSEHILNNPPEISADDPVLNAEEVLKIQGSQLAGRLVEHLRTSDDFVYIAGKWFPRALLIDVNLGNLNLAEAVLDMSGGGPLPTEELLRQVQLPTGVNERLAGFSLDLALQEDKRFDEVGSTGKVLWFLKRLEPKDVLETPLTLRYQPTAYDHSLLTEDMLALERRLDDEHSDAPTEETPAMGSEVAITLTFPHWRAGTLPISSRLSGFFPSALESPRIQFLFEDATNGNEISAWVVRLEKYVYGLRDWYLEQGVVPGSIIKLSKGNSPGHVMVKVEPHRSAKEWVRTALVGADGGVVYATLKQTVSTEFDDRMMVFLPAENEPLDKAWERRAEKPAELEHKVAETLRELAKLNPQAHVHVAELYSALNVIMRCPPGPIMAVLASQPWFKHVGDLHYRLDEGEWQEGRK